MSRMGVDSSSSTEDDARQAVQSSVSRETFARLELYVHELKRWQGAKNLVGPGTLRDVWHRHIVDSLQLIPMAEDRRVWLDLGSGAGLPGLIVAMAGPSTLDVHLVESNGRKCAFLRDVARKTGTLVHVHSERLEDVVPLLADEVDIVSARALAPLDTLLGWCIPLWRKGALGLFMKGQDVEAELTTASKSWMIQYDLLPSQTDPKARIVRIHSAAPR